MEQVLSWWLGQPRLGLAGEHTSCRRRPLWVLGVLSGNGL